MFYPGFERKLLNFVTTNESYKSRYAELPSVADDSLELFEVGAGEVGADTSTTEEEIKKYYTFNQTGNIMISSTAADEKDISPEVKKVFQKTIVFFGAWTAALSKAGKNLYDYEAIGAIIGKSGFFVKMHQEDRTFDYSSTQLTLNTAIIKNVLGGIDTIGGALSIAQKVVDSLGSELRVATEKSETTKKIAHLLFVCENLLGLPIVNISIFYTSAKEASFVTETNCHETVQKTINFQYHQDDYMFVDPDYINQFSDDFKANPEYEKLIEQLTKYITG